MARSPEEFAEEERRRAAVAYLCAAIRVCDRRDAAAIMAAALEEMAAGMPPVADGFNDLRADADFWADTATPPELAAYVGAGLRHIDPPEFAALSRKKLLLDLWDTMPESWRRQFVQRVDPEGRFHRGAA